MSETLPSRRKLRVKQKKRDIRKWVLIGTGSLVLVVVAIAAWIIPRAMTARAELEAAIPLASSVQNQLMAGDIDVAGTSAKKMSKHTAAARELTGDFVWQGLEWIPWAGENLKAVRLAAVSADELAVNAVVSAATIDIDGFKPIDGRIDVDAIRDLGTLVDSIGTSVIEAQERMSEIDRSQLISQVQSGVGRLDSALVEVSGLLGGMEKTVDMLPAFLGADEPRNYLMLFETNAETRGTGGLPGSLLLITIDDGFMEVTKQVSSGAFPYGRDLPILPIDAETEALYGSKIARFIGDITLTPNFPYTAQLAQAFWGEYVGGEVDGVMSFDPVALGYLLTATGPVTLATGEELTGENAAPLLLNESYFRYPDPKIQDVFFAAAAGSIFDAVKSGRGSTKELISAITKAVDERRLNFWSADSDEQLLLADAPIAGILPSDNEDTTAVGVYYNDNTGAKLEYYLDTIINVTTDQCTSSTPTMHGEIALSNTVTNAAALPAYVRGAWYKPGHIMMDLVVYGSVGGALSTFAVNGDPVTPTYLGTHLDRPAAKVTFRIKPGKTVTVTYDMAGIEGNYGPLEVRHTPMSRPVPVNVLAPGCK